MIIYAHITRLRKSQKITKIQEKGPKMRVFFLLAQVLTWIYSKRSGNTGNILGNDWTLLVWSARTPFRLNVASNMATDGFLALLSSVFAFVVRGEMKVSCKNVRLIRSLSNKR